MPSVTPLVSVIVPTYQEAGNIPLLVPRICAAMSAVELSVEIIIVDDDSRDGSEEAVTKLREQGLPVTITVRSGKRGLSSAVIRGFRQAGGELLVCMDADLSHPPEKIAELIAELRSGRADFVIGSRYVPGAGTDSRWGLLRWLNSKVATLLARPLVRVKDPMSGFFALSRQSFLDADELSPVGYKIGLELLLKTRCKKVVEVPIHFADRTVGESKLNMSEQLKYLKHLKRLFDYKYGAFSRFWWFCLVGATGVVVDLLSLNLLLVLTHSFKPSRAIAIGIAMTWNFLLNRRIAFSDARRDPWLGQYVKFVGSCLFGAVVSWLVSTTLVGWRPGSWLWIQTAALAGIACGTVSNFLFAYYFVFTVRGRQCSGRRPRRPSNVASDPRVGRPP